MHYPKWLRLLLPLGAVAGGLLLFGGTASAETTDATISAEVAVPVATDTGPDLSTSDQTSGWIDSTEGRKYQYSDGSFAVDAQSIDGILYLFQEDGTQLTGWQKIADEWHYYDPQTFQAATGVQKIDDTLYLFDFTGAQKTGWRTVDGVRRYYDPETGKPDNGWVTYAGNRYYVDTETGKQLGEFQVDGVRYLSDNTYGTQTIGFCTFADQTTSYYDEEGAPVSGWMTDTNTGKQYYFDTDYQMQTGWQTIDQKKYYLAEDGSMQTGLLTVGQQTYYFATDGSMQIGFQSVQQKKYYFGTDGAMQTGLQKVGQQTYYFAADGTMQTGFQMLNQKKYYFGADGIMQIGWQTIDSLTYYFNSDGTMLTGTQTIDGKKYTFLSDGSLKRIKICLDAGHYGKYNRSPVNGTYYESDMSWKLHLKLKSALESFGIEVITTRPTQEGDLGLETRGKKAAGCDLFLSLHSNACGNSSIDAPLACCTVTGTADVLGQKLADTVHQVMGTAQAGTIWKRVGEHGDYYGVLRGATSVGVPAILLEHSYHTNLRATNWLLSDANLQRMAEAEAATIAAYFGL